MRRYPNHGNIRPKISTMPRQQTEAAVLLDLYKLTVERQRLQQELKNLELRRQQIGDRLTQLNREITVLEGSHERSRSLSTGESHQKQEETVAPSPALPPKPPKQTQSSDSINTLYLEY